MRIIGMGLLLLLGLLAAYGVWRWRAGRLPGNFHDPLARTFSRNGWLARLWPLWLGFIASFAVVAMQNPLKGWLVLYAISKILLGGLVGLVIHWGFRRIHPMPENPSGIEIGTDWKCAAWIICAAVLALALVP